MRVYRGTFAGAVGLGLALLLAGCRQDMYDQPRYEPWEASSFFADGTSDRPLVPGTVPRNPRGGAPLGDELFYTGKVGGKDADEFPFPIGRADLERGRQRFMIFCSPCHGAAGDGRGMIVERGFSPPPSFYDPRPKASQTPVAVYDDLLKAPVGHFFGVMTRGHGAMYSYAARIPPEDRWRIAAYIRALQLSQRATLDDLKAIKDPNDDERRLLGEAGR
jgi:mono/diheme cytochrome c family protein